MTHCVILPERLGRMRGVVCSFCEESQNKKQILAFILFLAMVSFVGRVPERAAVSDPLPRRPTSGTLGADQTGHLRFSRGTLAHGNEQGCYFVLPALSGGASLRWYADYKIQQLVELCTQPNCAQDKSNRGSKRIKGQQ